MNTICSSKIHCHYVMKSRIKRRFYITFGNVLKDFFWRRMSGRSFKTVSCDFQVFQIKIYNVLYSYKTLILILIVQYTLWRISLQRYIILSRNDLSLFFKVVFISDCKNLNKVSFVTINTSDRIRNYHHTLYWGNLIIMDIHAPIIQNTRTFHTFIVSS